MSMSCNVLVLIDILAMLSNLASLIYSVKVSLTFGLCRSESAQGQKPTCVTSQIPYLHHFAICKAISYDTSAKLSIMVTHYEHEL